MKSKFFLGLIFSFAIFILIGCSAVITGDKNDLISENSTNPVKESASESVSGSLFSDDFQSGAIGTDWTIQSGTWTIADDGTKVVKLTSSGGILKAGSTSWTNYKVTARIKTSTTASMIALIGRFKDPKNYYYVALKNNIFYIYKKVNDTTSVVAQTPYTFSASTFYKVALIMDGTTLKGFINDSQNPIITATDTSHSTGQIGFRCEAVNSVYDDVVVEPLTAPVPVGTIRDVSSSAEWTTAINNSASGDTINVKANIGTALSITNKNFSTTNPLKIKAASPQGITLLSLAMLNCKGINVENFKFGPSAVNTYTLLKADNCSNIKISRNYFDLHNVTLGQTAIIVSSASSNIDIGYNTFADKDYVVQGGSYIKVSYNSKAGTFPSNVNIRNNYFKNIVPVPVGTSYDGDSDRECIIIGSTGTNVTPGNNIIENNLFEECDGEGELISLKCSNNIIRYNTFVNCLGGVSIRTGEYNEVYGNFFFANSNNKNAYPNDTGGVRTYGSHHKVYNNYFEGLTGKGYNAPLCIDGGDTTDPVLVGGHVRSNDCYVVNNTLVNCSYGIELGYMNKSAKTPELCPTNCKIANNIIYDTKDGNLFTIYSDNGTIFAGNIGYNSLPGATFSSAQLKIADPKLSLSGGFYKIASDSPAVNSAVGTYSYVTTDCEGQARSANDVGADEYSSTPITKKPLTPSTAGCSAP